MIDDTSEASHITTIEDLTEELPDNTPRFVVLSYPIEHSDGRKSTPFVLLYYRPPTSTQNNRMLYAGAVEMVRHEAGVGKVIEIEETEELEEIEKSL